MIKEVKGMRRIYPVALLLLLLAGRGGAETITLRDSLQKVADHNHELKVAAYNEQIVEETIQTARSGYLPRIDSQGGYTAQKDAQAVIFNNNALPTQEADYFFFNAALTQTLYDFGRTSARYQRSIVLKEAAANDYKSRSQELFLQTVQIYFGILEGKRLLLASEDEVKQMTDHRRVAQNLYEQGVVTRNDLLQAEVLLASSEQLRLAAANRVENGWLLLNYLTGAPPDFHADLDESQDAPPAPAESGLETALANRPELKAMKNLVAASELEVQESRGGYLPELFGRLAVDYLQNKWVREQTIMSATVGLKINLFDGLATTARYRQAVKARSQNEERLRQLEAQSRLEYQSATNDAQVAAAQISVTETSIRQAEENLRINRDRYQEHVGTATDVIDAQTLLTQARTENYRAVFNYQVALARIKKACGEL